MFQLLIGLGIFTAVLLVLVILAQNSKGGGLSSQFGGSGASNIMGVKKTGDLLERLTWIFIVVIILVSLGTSVIGTGVNQSDDILNRVKTQSPGSSLPELPAAKPDSAK